MSETQIYTGRRLKEREVRLLYISASLFQLENGGMIPQCTFERHSLRNPELYYQALSYNWGDASDTRPILVDGKVRSVTRNLRVFLNHFLKAHRQYGYGVYPWCALWIDAICINQIDTEEKSTQVGQMAQIYSQAARVLVWLGPESNNSKLAMTTLSKIVTSPDGRDLTNLDSLGNQLQSRVLDTADDRVAVTALSSFFRRPWFFRAWVRQEVIRAKIAVVACGTDTLSWKSLLKAVAIIAISGTNPTIRKATIGDLSSMLFAGNSFFHMVPKPQPLHEILQTDMICARTQASLPQDCVYSLLGLVDEKDIQCTGILKPDYSKPFDQVFIEASHYLYAAIGGRTLHLCSFRKGSPVPSWVPDWTSPSRMQGGYDGSRLPCRAFASGFGKPFAYEIESRMLYVNGTCVGSVQPHVASVNEPTLNDPSSYRGYRKLISEFTDNLYEQITRTLQEDYTIAAGPDKEELKGLVSSTRSKWTS